MTSLTLNVYSVDGNTAAIVVKLLDLRGTKIEALRPTTTIRIVSTPESVSHPRTWSGSPFRTQILAPAPLMDAIQTVGRRHGFSFDAPV